MLFENAMVLLHIFLLNTGIAALIVSTICVFSKTQRKLIAKELFELLNGDYDNA